MASLLRGVGRHRLTRGGFTAAINQAPQSSARRENGAVMSRGPETAALPANIVQNAFAKPTAMPMSTGIISESPQAQILMAREMADNDSVAGAVAETLGGIPFGRFSLSGLPDVKHQEPYLRSMDHMRTQTLMPLLTTTFLVDGAFLGSGVFDSGRRSWTAMILQDLLHATITPVPFFGTTPIIDVQLSPEMTRGINSTDPRMSRYRRFLTDELQSGSQRLQPENTFYIPRRTQAHHVMGQSLFRRIMIIYVLEKALARGTIELAYRRQRPMLHIQVGDENWDATIDEMSEIANLFQNADLDPYGATVVTRPGVMTNEVSGAGDFWKWTDNIDSLTSVKLKGLGMPDGLLGGDSALDSVSATLTVFINMTRQLRDYITRAFMYEKMFPYLAVTNGHRKDLLGAFEEHGAEYSGEYSGELASYYRSVASDIDVDMSEYMMPTVTWHNSLRPEGDRDYLALLQELNAANVPIPLRVMAAAGGQDMHDLLNGERDDLELRARTAKYQAAINELNQAAMPQQQGYDDQGQGQDAQYASAAATRVRRRGLVNREYKEQDLPFTSINGHRYVTTARERKRRMEEENTRVIAPAMARAARVLNRSRTHTVSHGWSGRSPI